ncbi:MAG: LamG-like jellyroll fold domain-containing protein [Candidatus Brocadiia bacterium]
MRTARLLVVGVMLGLALGVAPQRARAQEYSWHKPHARVLPNGDLEWAPEPFEFEPLGEIRYIDYEGGDDANPGTRAAPWKHHPWDPRAAGKAKAGRAPTYVFKQGVAYRGSLVAPKGASARLTRDPDWGEGEARFYGSEAVRGGWTRGADHPEIPEPGKVWYIDLDFAPRNLWMVEGDRVTRIPIARDPNWTEPDPQDPMSEWYTWEQPDWWKQQHRMEIEGETYHLGIDKKVLTSEAEDYVGGTVWTEWGIVMGSPYPSRIRGYDPKKKGIAFGGPWVWGASEKIITNNRYYLEDLPRFLDSPGEFWFAKKGRGGRLYLRLPGDRDPNSVTLEAGRYVNLIDAEEVGRLEVSGLTFRFANTHWEYDIPQWAHPDLRAGVFRLQGSGDELRFENNRFEHVHMPVRVGIPKDGGHVKRVTIADNVVRYTDHGAFHVKSEEGKTVTAGRGRLDRVDLLRNKLHHIGWRVLAGAHGHAISVQAVKRAHVAGNMLDRIAGWGISVSGGKRWAGPDFPLVRDIVHHNRVKDCLLKSCDWGAFYITQGGPHYIYNNVAINPVGQMNWAGKRLGYAYYMDGGYKGYLFNNIAVGRPVEKGHKRRTAAAFQSMVSFQNTYFNNTAYQFKAASRRQGPQGGREKYLANIFQDIGDWVFRHAKPADSPEAANAAHLPKEDAAYPYETNAYSHNVLFDIGELVGVFETHGMPYASFAAFVGAVEDRKALAADVGVIAERSPLRDPAGGDFRPAPGSATLDYGAKAFVPWSLHGMVGEWNFTINRENPARILDEHWYMTPYYVERKMYRKTPRYHLTGVNIDEGDYAEGPLEDWTAGALTLNGRDQYARLTHEQIAAPFAYEVPVGKGKTEERVTAGRGKMTVDIGTGNFLIEAYVRAEAGDDGVLVSKADDRAGYVLEVREGRPRLIVLADGEEAASLTAETQIADGQWHHLIAEVDRSRADGITIYVDGTDAGGSASGAVPGSSLSNEGDFLAGGGPGLEHLACTLDFLRVARGTLADAETTIEELYAWQFDGPQLRDFAGREPVVRRDAGAIELAD